MIVMTYICAILFPFRGTSTDVDAGTEFVRIFRRELEFRRQRWGSLSYYQIVHDCKFMVQQIHVSSSMTRNLERQNPGMHEAWKCDASKILSYQH